MARASIPPLLRGIGTTIVLCAGIVSFIIAHTDINDKRASQQYEVSVRMIAAEPQLNRLATEVDEMRHEIQENGIIDDVFKNPWFEILGFLGTAVIASSFYSEWMIRKDEKAPGMTDLAAESQSRISVEESDKNFAP
jgi:hypothetical protein